MRRGKRYRYKPLEFWRGEHVVVGRPTRNDPPVPIIHEIIRVPQEEVVHLGVDTSKRRGTSKPPSSRAGSRKPKSKAETYVENPEEGWDEETQEMGSVMDYETKEELQRGMGSTLCVLRYRPCGQRLRGRQPSLTQRHLSAPTTCSKRSSPTRITSLEGSSKSQSNARSRVSRRMTTLMYVSSGVQCIFY